MSRWTMVLIVLSVLWTPGCEPEDEEEAGWRTEVVDTMHEGAGVRTIIGYDEDGKLYITFSGSVRQAMFDGEAWGVEELVGSTGPYGAYPDMAMHEENGPAVSYRHSSEDELRCVYVEDGNRKDELIAEGDIGGATAVGFQDNTEIPVLARWHNDGWGGNDPTGINLHYHWRDDLIWLDEVVDSEEGVSIGKVLAMDVHRLTPYIAYHVAQPGILRWAWRQDQQWHTEDITEMDQQDDGTFIDLALDSDDRPHLVFSGNNAHAYAYYDVDGWQFEDGASLYAHGALALDGEDRAHVVSAQFQGYVLFYSVYDGVERVTHEELKTVDGEQLAGAYGSITLDADGNPHIAYQDFENDQLMHAWYTPE